ncbi:MAG: nucleotidyl transferase AbiEii/AbiGii toxin family protein [Rubritalea sp.]|tara:strand:- start:93 stop:989 length:897 start_codon:yes stop_codon:yes gene_type:complete
MNLTASLQDRLRNQARQHGTSFASMLEQFALSRFLARLAMSDHADQFILKGAQLFRFLSAKSHRPTRDADFLSYGDHTADELGAIFTTICEITPLEEDALAWENVRSAAIRDENAYGGVRVLITAKLGKVKIPLQFDIGFGDAITPAILHQSWPSLLGYSEVPLATYPLETVIAEKLEAAVSLGINNSRMKDFYDLHWLLSHLTFDGAILTQAVKNTFARRATDIPKRTPLAFTGEFSSDSAKVTQWKSFLRKSKLPQQELTTTIQHLSDFLQPVLAHQVAGYKWTPEEQWQPIDLKA